MRVEKILKQKYNTLLDKYNLLKAEIEQQTLFKRHINTYELEQTQKQLQEIFTQIEAVSIYKPTNQERQKGFKI